MFKNLLQFWKGKDFLSKVLEEFKNMLDDSQAMFNSVCSKLIDSKEEPHLKERIYTIDKKVNDLQKNIRKRVIEHLSIQPSVDVTTCLLLMSVVKDAERLGDYAKNLLEVSGLLEKPVNKDTYMGLFNGIEQEISDLFKQTKEAFIESDESKAAKSWEYQKEIKQRCDEIIRKLARSSLSVNEAVCFTLTARYFKRIASHLTNIATSVILPLTELDYFDEKRKED
ncbi:MAG: PhoU domain-containing protein [Candidatus Omnitrophica bacterium]|nr:PhoU domain-containing protein [Candidatus Omnitrophota bacterium]MDD5429782.1 PhoU domain-containing protein [Candidatus Omnitrophota bacterium]